MVGTSLTLLCPPYGLCPVIASEARQSCRRGKKDGLLRTHPRNDISQFTSNLIGSFFGPFTKVRLRHLDFAVERERFQPRQQFLEQDPHFELGQILAETEMRAITKRDMAVRLAARSET